MPFPFIGPRTPGNACTFLLRVMRQRFSSVNREAFDYEFFFFFFETTLREDCFAIATKDVLNFVEMTRFDALLFFVICIFKDNHISISFFSSGIQSKYKWPLINGRRQRRRALFFVGLKRIGSKICMFFISTILFSVRTDLIFLCESIVSPILLFARDPI